MINDLAGQSPSSDDAYFAVIGAGTVGLPLSVLLAEKTGKKVICLETGGYEQAQDTHPLNQVVQRATHYRGASDGRYRCFGGTSTRWGGALIPFQDADLRNADWPIYIDELTPYIRDVESLFSLKQGAYSDTSFPFALGEHHINRMAKWPRFKKRNVAALLHKRASNNANLQIWLNAQVTAISAGNNGVTLTARSPQGNRIEISAKKLIIAAGAIETTRLALLIQANHFEENLPALGRFFTDHISTEVAEIVTSNPSSLNKLIGLRFDDKGSMRNIRFELSAKSIARQKLPPSFVHIGFKTEHPSGFDVLRALFQNIQRGNPPPPRILLDLVLDTPWLLRALWWRIVHKRLLFPVNARLIVHAVVEQIPSQNNYISLSACRTDEFGVPLAEIHWSVTDRDKYNVVETTELFRKMWQSTRFAQIGLWKSRDAKEIQESAEFSQGIFHPTGSTRMGSNSQDGVVDKNLKMFGFPNIQLLSTSVLPTGGGANPTMMLFLLTMRCLDQHCKSLLA
jgi:choline dehydrogenase-like flavoprotein